LRGSGIVSTTPLLRISVACVGDIRIRGGAAVLLGRVARRGSPQWLRAFAPITGRRRGHGILDGARAGRRERHLLVVKTATAQLAGDDGEILVGIIGNMALDRAPVLF